MRTCLIPLFLWAAFVSLGAQSPEFAVASVKRHTEPITAGFKIQGGPGTADPERISYLRFPMQQLLIDAFTLKPDELVGPGWMSSTEFLYDIEANVEFGSTKEQVNQMMQNLLKHRFGLSFHFEKRTFTGFDLVIANGGPKLRLAAPLDPGAALKGESVTSGPQVKKDREGFPVLPPGRAGFRGVAGADQHMRLTARSQPLSSLLKILQKPLDTDHLVDKTGLKGIYDFELDYALGAPGPAVGEPVDSGQDVFTAVQKQLGLRLTKAKMTSDVLVIDNIETVPTPN